jgi:hypothetical protein
VLPPCWRRPSERPDARLPLRPKDASYAGAWSAERYAGAWSAERGRCHRFVYDPEGKPDNCPEPTVTSGWRRDYLGRWYVVDACARHAPQLMKRPRPGHGSGS